MEKLYEVTSNICSNDIELREVEIVKETNKLYKLGSNSRYVSQILRSRGVYVD